MTKSLAWPLAALSLVIALCALSCGGNEKQDLNCQLPTSVTPGWTACTVEFSNVGESACYDAAYKIDCTKGSSGFDCTCTRDGAVEKTCTAPTLCDGASVENTNTIKYVNACCGWSVAQ